MTQTHRARELRNSDAEVEIGAHLLCGSELKTVYGRAASFVDRLLKGAKRVDFPVEQPIEFEFFINLNAAKQIGLTIPSNVLARADRVIR